MALMRTVDPLLAISRPKKRAIALCVDTALCVITVWVAFYLRLGEWIYLSDGQWIAVAVSLGLALPLFVVCGLYRAIFRYGGRASLLAVARAVLIYGLLYSAIFTTFGVPGVPRTVGIIQPILLLVAIALSRGAAQYWLGGPYRQLLTRNSLPRVLIYGADHAGQQLADAISAGHESRVVGFLDDSRDLHRRSLNGLPVFDPAAVKGIVAEHRVGEILFSNSALFRRHRRDILTSLSGTAVKIKTLPALIEIAKGRVRIDDLREIQIEDLLGREAVAPSDALMGRHVVGKTVLVTGAGGSIGSELCHQLLARQPATLLLVEASEYALYAVLQKLAKLASAIEPPPQIVPLLGSVQNAARMREIFAQWRPQTVYHAAAYKHVPLVEQNPLVGIQNNTFGTLTVARAAIAAEVADFVLISTDKAVRPTNIMGVTKRLAEMILQALAAVEEGTRFSMVRFGNVLDSSGSVVPLFRQQIKDGGPVTVTHREMTRYFMSIPEAAQLVIQAGAMAAGGEVFVLDMGEPVRIHDLARRMIELAGLTLRDGDNPGGDIEIAVIGTRPGEKLYEELLIGNNPAPTAHPLIMKANEPFLSWPALADELDRMAAAIAEGREAEVRAQLGRLVPEYVPDEACVPVPA